MKRSSKTTRKPDRRTKSEDASGPTYKDELASAIHESLCGLAKLGAVDDATVLSFEKAALAPVCRFSGEQIQELRQREKATQAVFAHHLGVSVNTVSQWERGERDLAGAAAKLLSLVEKHGLAHII